MSLCRGDKGSDVAHFRYSTQQSIHSCKLRVTLPSQTMKPYSDRKQGYEKQSDEHVTNLYEDGHSQRHHKNNRWEAMFHPKSTE